jgi:hypothetical protein
MARGAKAQDALRKQKEARQKKLLIGLAPVLLALLAWQGPGMLSAFTGGDAPPAAATPTTNTTAESSPAAAPTAAAPTTAGAAPADEAAPGTPATLPDTDDPDAAAQGQLVSFDRFVGKDPFKQQIKATQDEPAAAGGGSGNVPGGGSGGAPSGPPTDGGGSGGGAPAELPTSATIDVNGQRQEVFVDSTFPEIEPIFRIVSFGAKSARFTLVTGEFSNGSSTLKLELRKPLTLVSQPDGLQYVITLVALGNRGA